MYSATLSGCSSRKRAENSAAAGQACRWRTAVREHGGRRCGPPRAWAVVTVVGPPAPPPTRTRLLTRCGIRIASSSATAAPIDSPTTCALAIAAIVQHACRVGGEHRHRDRRRPRRRAPGAAVVVGDDADVRQVEARRPGSNTAEEIVQPVISSTGSPAPRSVTNSRGLLRVRTGQLRTRERVGDRAVRLAVGHAARCGCR